MADSKALEKKMRTLEERLVLVERFVEMRFCESFRDFSVRNLSTRRTGTEGKGQVSAAKRVDDSVEDVDEGDQFDGFEDDLPPSPPPPESPERMEDDENLTTTTYRTRSGRKSTRLTAKALGVSSSGSRTAEKKEVSRKLEETKTSKVLRVSVRRLEGKLVNTAKDNKTTEEEDEVNNEEDPPVVKINVESDVEGNGGREEGDGGDDYFMFPSGGDTGQDMDASGDGRDDQGMEMEGDNDGDWNPSGGEDEEDHESKPKVSKRKSATTSTSTKPGSSKSSTTPSKRRKYIVAGSLNLLPEGIKLQLLNPDQANLKECPLCHVHVKPESYDRHMKTHVVERHLKCSQCDMRFFSKPILIKHERRHKTGSQTKMKECRVCTKSVLSPNMIVHERRCIKRHLEEGKKVDPKVIEDVRQKSQGVQLHWPDPNEKVPEGMRRCARCSKHVEENQYLKHLQEAHSNWKCNFCDKVYVGKTGLVRHLCNAHGNNRKTCDLCKKTFESRDEIRRHNEQCKREHSRKKKEVGGDKSEPEETSKNASSEEETT